MDDETRDGNSSPPRWERRHEKQLDADAFHIWMPRPLLRSIRWQPEPAVPREASSGSYEVFLTQAALREAHRHVWFAEPGVEPFGFLVGDLCEDPETNRRYVIISGAVPCRLSFDEHGEQQISAEAEVALQLEVDRNRGVLVGWYHRHWKGPPALTEADLRTHRELFTEPWHTAMVFVTDPAEPKGALFRRTSHGFDGSTPLPFYEMVSNESLMAKGVRRSWIDWKNVTTSDGILQETPDRPTDLVPPLSEEELEAARMEAKALEELDRDLVETEVPGGEADEVATPHEAPAGAQAVPAIESPATVEGAGGIESPKEREAHPPPTFEVVPPPSRLEEFESSEEPEGPEESEAIEETELSGEAEPIHVAATASSDDGPADEDIVPGLTASPMDDLASAASDDPVERLSKAVEHAAATEPSHADAEAESTGPAEPVGASAGAGESGGSDLPEGMLAALKEVLAEVSEGEAARIEEEETEDAPLTRPADVLSPATAAPEVVGPAPQPNDAEPGPPSDAEPGPPSEVPATRPGPPTEVTLPAAVQAARRPPVWKRAGPIALAALIVIAIAASVYILGQRSGPVESSAAAPEPTVITPPAGEVEGPGAGPDEAAGAMATDSFPPVDTAAVPTAPAETSADAPPEGPITSEEFEDLRDGLLAAISSFYGRAVALDNGQASCADLQTSFIAVEDAWITYNVDGKARLGGRLTGEDATRDERLYAGVQDVEREFDRSGCERP